MKYMIFALSLTLCSVNPMSDATQLNHIDDMSLVPLLSKNYKTAERAIADKNISALETLAAKLTVKEQIQLYQQTQYELSNAPSTLKLFTKNSLCFCWGVGIIAAGSLNFLLNYASGVVDSTCQDQCSTITKKFHPTDDPQLCNTICSTISQDKLHALAVPAGITITTTGLAFSVYSVYSFFTHLNDKKKLRAMITTLQISDHYSDDDATPTTTSTDNESDDSDSTETV